MADCRERIKTSFATASDDDQFTNQKNEINETKI